MCVHEKRKEIRNGKCRAKTGFLSKTLIFRENVDLLPAASGDGFVLDSGMEEQAGDVHLGERP